MDPCEAASHVLQQGDVHMFHSLGSTGVDTVSSMLARCVSEASMKADSSVTQARA